MFIKLNKKGQSTVEYAVVFAIVAAVILGMKVYVERGMKGRLRDATNYVGVGGAVAGGNFAFTGEQYEPYYASSAGQSQNDKTARDQLLTDGAVNKDIVGQEESRAARTQVTGWGGENVPTPNLP